MESLTKAYGGDSRLLLIGAIVASCWIGLSCERATKSVLLYRSDADLKTLEAPVGGTWSLYHADDATPILEVTVPPGTRIGFERDKQSGELMAVAGETTRVLSAKEYYWAHE